MKKIIRILVVSFLLIGVLVNNACAGEEWGIDEKGKFCCKHILVIIKDEYINEPETVVTHIKTEYGVERVIITSETDAQPLTLLVVLPILGEKYFYSVFDALSQDKYVEFAFKEYYVGTDKSYLGDVNQDGRIQTDDAYAILRYAAGHIEPETKTQEILADVDEDGLITTQDARYALSVACGII
ncbi:MAG: dockerin type I repeat-containing protein [Clostridia bacterium]|nr:dockerin type I repeat-containing protein [Clostridia bacterium]